jgi:hypothetical protein
VGGTFTINHRGRYYLQRTELAWGLWSRASLAYFKYGRRSAMEKDGRRRGGDERRTEVREERGGLCETLPAALTPLESA